MKKVLVTIGALAMAFSIASVASADTLLVPARTNCGNLMPSFAYYQQLAPKCCRTIVSPCCGAAAPVEPCGCGCAKPACGCEKPKCGCEKAKKHLFKKHTKKACKCKS